MARACQARAATTEPFIDTVNTARDMDRIRQALGVSKISYYGLSYGTVLGAVYADLFPHRVATMVLDGAVDVNASLTRQAEEAAPAEEQSLLHLFATCLQQAPCPLGSDPQAFFTRLAASLTDHPLPAPGHGDTSPVTVGDLDTATLFELSVVQGPRSYYSALLAAQHGDGAPLRTLALVFDTDIDGAPLVDPLWAITCNDAAGHPGPLAAGDLARTLNARYPLIGGVRGDLHDGRLRLVAVGPATGDGSPPEGDAADHGHRQHRRSQHPDHRGRASGRHLPHCQHGDVARVGPYLVAQRFDRPVHAGVGHHLPLRRRPPPFRHRLRLTGCPGCPGCCHRYRTTVTSSRSRARRGHSAAARVARPTSSASTGVPSTMG